MCASAKHHFGRRVPVDEHHDWYAPLYQRLYPLIAVRYYCPSWIKATWFAESIRGFDWPITYEGIDVGAQKPQCEHCLQACCVYAVGNEVDNIDGGQGMKLEQEGVEVLECIRVPKELDEQHPRVKAWREWVAREEAEW